MLKNVLKNKIYWPFFGLIPIVLGAWILSGSEQYIQTCTDGELCGLDQALGSIVLIGAGILYAVIAGLVAAVIYRKKIDWAKWLLIWVVCIAIGAGAVIIGKKHDDNYYHSHPLFENPEQYKAMRLN